jgi:PiT family inorganic phosphate transporter
VTALLTLIVLSLAFANGANDNFKGVATLYGSRSLSYRAAVSWATASTLAGSSAALLFSGGLVKQFSGSGLVADAVVADPAFLLAVAAGAAAAVLLATRFGFPISTTHALLGGLIGAGLVLAGPASLAYGTLGAFLRPSSSALAVSRAVPRGVAVHHAPPGAAPNGDHRGGVRLSRRAGTGGGIPGAGEVRLGGGMTVVVDSHERCERRYWGSLFGISAQALLDRAHVVTAGAVGFARGLRHA